MRRRPAVLIDFDGTLGWRPGLWGGATIELLDELDPAHGLSVERVRAGLRDGFPWHAPHVPHPELSRDPDAWWAPIERLVATAVRDAGGSPAHATHVAGGIRARFSDPARGWTLFDDSVPALARLRNAGFRIVVLSNHVPELPLLVRALGLEPYLDAVLSSALLGVEKPHPEAFRLGLAAAGAGAADAWMVGDNPVADVEGAQAAGIRAVRVRTGEPGPRSVADVAAAAALILDAHR